MLLGKIKTPVKKIYQGQGLSTIEVSCEYIAIAAENYEMNQPLTKFRYKIGKVEFHNKHSKITFKDVIRGSVEIKAEDLTSWGADDYAAIKIVADKLGLELDDEGKIDEANINFKS